MNKVCWYGLTVILKNIGHFGNHSTYSVITVILVQKTVILRRNDFGHELTGLNGHFGKAKMIIAQNLTLKKFGYTIFLKFELFGFLGIKFEMSQFQNQW